MRGVIISNKCLRFRTRVVDCICSGQGMSGGGRGFYLESVKREHYSRTTIFTYTLFSVHWSSNPPPPVIKLVTHEEE